LKAYVPIISQRVYLLSSAAKVLRGCESCVVRGNNVQDKEFDEVGSAHFKKAAKKEFRLFIKKYLKPINLKDVNK